MLRILSFLFVLCIAFNVNGYGQNPQIGCKDANLVVQASEQKQSLLAQGFEIINDAMLSMFSREEFPIVVRLQAGVFYQFLYVGNTRSKKMNLKLIAPNQQIEISKEQQPLNQTSNIISFSYTPAQSGDYTLLLSQNMKQELLKFKGTAATYVSCTFKFEIKKIDKNG